MKKENIEQYIENFRKPMAIFGLILVGVGGLILLYIGIIILQIIINPEEVKIVEFFLTHIKVNETTVIGQFGGNNFTITLSESIRTILFLFIGALIFSVLAGIVRMLISAGISIIKLSSINKHDKA